ARLVVTKYPADFDGWLRYAEILKETGKAKEAVQALAKAVACPNAGDDPEHWFNTVQRLAAWADQAQDYAALEAAARKSLELLDRHRAIFRTSGFVSDDDYLVEKGDALEGVGRACLKQRKFDAALNADREAASLFAGRQDNVGIARQQRLHLHLAELHEARGTPAEGLPHITAYLKLRPQSVDPYRLYVTLLRAAGQGNDAPARLAECAHRDKGNAALQLFLAELYTDTNNFSEALKTYDALLAEAPRVEYYRGLLRLCLKFRQMEQVLTRLDDHLKAAEEGAQKEEARDLANRHARALYAALKENSAALRSLLMPTTLDELLRQVSVKQNFNYRTFDKIASLAAQSQELEAAEELFRAALLRARWPGLKASIDGPLIDVLLARRKYSDVIELCEQRLQRPEQLNQFMYTYYMALAQKPAAGPHPALDTIEQAARLAQNDDMRLLARAQKVEILLWHRETADAVKEAEKLRPDFPLPKHARRVRLILAQTYGAARDHAKAEQQLRILLETDPNDAQANNDLGYQLADQGRNLDEAERLVRHALEVDRLERQRGAADEDADDDPLVGENAAYLDSLGWVLFRRGKLAEARDWLEKSAALPGGKDDPTVWDHLGDVHFRLGDSPRAKAAWTKAAGLYEEERRGKKDGRSEELRRKLTLIQ
ncbi:MAG: tetratricopeptide repeat protein, partial [Gemmataceae bacterium]